MMGKITDNHSYQKVLQFVRLTAPLRWLYNKAPGLGRRFPILKSLEALHEQAKILDIPDAFNTTFAPVGWIAYESMNLEAMQKALEIHHQKGLDAAEQYLADCYNEETLDWAIHRLKHQSDFSKRIRLLELAKIDYLEGRYHACIPLLLALIDGLVGDITSHIGFFAEDSDMTAWDSIAGHETGLATIAKVMGIGRNKTNEKAITIPYRNGILHGRELSFDNQIVAAKCWATLFALDDWAKARLSEQDRMREANQQFSWSDTLRQLKATSALKHAVEDWQPRQTEDMPHIPYPDQDLPLPENSPEAVLAEFMDNWSKGRFGLMAENIIDSFDIPAGKKAGRAKQDYGNRLPHSYRILYVKDIAAAVSEINIELFFLKEEDIKTIKTHVRLIYKDSENNPAVRGYENGRWYLIEHELINAAYSNL